MKGFSVGDQVEYSITEDCLYLATVKRLVPESNTCWITLHDKYSTYQKVNMDRLSHKRSDRCKVVPPVGTEVHVLEYKDDDTPIWWWKATISDAKCYYSECTGGPVRVTFKNGWKCVQLQDIRLAVPPKEEEEEEEEPSCKYCKNRPCFGGHSVCGSCYVSDKVDAVMDVLEERTKAIPMDWKPPHQYHWKWRQLILTRALVAQSSANNSKRRQKRLQKQLVELSAWLDDVLPEHLDEQAWEPSE